MAVPRNKKNNSGSLRTFSGQSFKKRDGSANGRVQDYPPTLSTNNLNYIAKSVTANGVEKTENEWYPVKNGSMV